MKNPLVITSLLLLAGYSCAFAAESVGILPPIEVSLPVFIAAYASCGLLAIAVRDYGGKSSPSARFDRKPVATPALSATTTRTAETTWSHHTLSA